MSASTHVAGLPFHKLPGVLKPIDQAVGLANEFYTDSNYFEFERDKVLAQGWLCIGFANDVKKTGFVKPVEFMGLPLLLMRNSEGVLQVFHNVCSHRGMRLVQKEAETMGAIVCPYHSWTYDLQGALKGTPHVGGVNKHKDPRFACEKHGLKPIRSHVWMDLIFINLSETAPTFEAAIAPLTERWAQFIGSDGMSLLHPAKDDCTYNVNCNWKLAVDNYCEAYHLPWIHPSLNSYSRLEDHYNIMFGQNFAGQGSYAYNLADVAGTKLPTFPAWPKERLRNAEYVALFPNVLLGLQADHAFAMVLEPVSPSKTIEHLRLYFIDDAAASNDYATSRASVLDAWRTVFAEDIVAIEGMQQGRQSPGYQGGAFSPEMDQPTHYFHQWNARRILEKVAPGIEANHG
ncbi:MAG: aromatic ring-hydroxylating dioxygenase subunit alpha [Candidimonas sp.]|nr:MAG: aromatic ring-hydroxylating dioxygenase subunit alpha [Candidimonas sp.]TAM22095.1 MAG: aromatic ring-hydroxylating dioxygenase subunit alpha [Candidimonas sp.]